ncbi:MAG: PDZ domain-containing protein [Peptococcaceae bacterium]|nr:PDZ domain-containing protein [Peptococcaceae bacterium]
MFPFFEVLPLILKSFLWALADPQFLSLFLLVMVVIAVQYGRMDRMREGFFGQKTGRARSDVLAAAGFGLLGGLAGSLLMVFIGLTISGAGLAYLWPVAILLMLINMRFLCFAYAGGVLALANLLLGFPQVNVPQVMALVAVLHMVESFLILAGGHLGAVPAYVKGPGGRVIGGFTLQKFWPIPIVVLAVVAGGLVEGGVEMPGWWPLIKPGVPGDPAALTYVLLPVVAGLGYGDIAIARSPAEKSRLSSLYLGAYSLVLLVLAVLAGQGRGVALAAALFAPLGHEAVIYAGRRVEFRGKPLYTPPARGVRVLDVLPESPAWRAGLRSGDVILAVNGVSLTGRAALGLWLKSTFLPLAVDYHSRAAGVSRRGMLYPPGPGKPWGIVPVPEGDEDQYVELVTTGPLGRWLQKIWAKFKS